VIAIQENNFNNLRFYLEERVCQLRIDRRLQSWVNELIIIQRFFYIILSINIIFLLTCFFNFSKINIFGKCFIKGFVKVVMMYLLSFDKAIASADIFD
jgi:hypothetical protein